MSVGERLRLSLMAGFGATPARMAFYVFMAGTAYLVVRFVLQRWFRHRRISRLEASSGQMRREFLQSMRTIVIFGAVHGLLVYAALSGWTQLYRHVDSYGWVWLGISIGIMVLMHDTYFYWTHRLMHHPRLFKAMHSTHHQSICTTPWAAYSFSSVEALVQAGIAPLIAFTVPVHPVAFGVFMMWQMGFNVAGHCGYELFPRRFMGSRLAGILNSVTHHGLHHEKVNGNFGLYFNVWDRLMGTTHAHYETRFNELTNHVVEG